MQIPLRINFRGMAPSPAAEARIREMAERLERFSGRITGCTVAVRAPHRHGHKGRLFEVAVRVTSPGHEIVGKREHRFDHAHEDVYVAIRDAFDAVTRRLEDVARKARGKTKTHAEQPHGTVARLLADHGFITTSDDREIYFHRNSVVDGKFDSLRPGAAVRFAEELGDEGPQASTVHVVGKHHIVGPARPRRK